MITRGIIEEVLDDGYHVRVRIPVYHKAEFSAFSTPFEELPIAPICTAPGILPAYKKGDVVFVGFENDETDNPVVLGPLYRSEDTSTSNIKSNSLEVNVNCNLPNDVVIGDLITNKTLKDLSEVSSSVQGQINLIDEKILAAGQDVEQKIAELLQKIAELEQELEDRLQITIGTLQQGSQEITITDNRITSNNIILSYYTSIFGVNPIEEPEINSTNHTVKLKFDIQQSNMIVGVGIEGSYQ